MQANEVLLDTSAWHGRNARFTVVAAPIIM